MIVFFVLAALQGMAQKKVQINLKVGDKLHQELKRTSHRQDMKPSGETIEYHTENIVGFTYEILSAGGGTYDAKVTYSFLKFKAGSPGSEGEITFDSQNGEDMAGEMGEAVKGVIGKSYVFTIDANTHKVTAIKEGLAKGAAAEKQPGPLDPGTNLFPQDDEALKRRVEGAFGGSISDQTPVAGAKWDRSITDLKKGITTKTTVNYTLNRIDGDQIYIDATGKSIVDGVPEGMEEMGDFNLTAVFDSQTNIKVDAKAGILSEVKSKTKGEQTFYTPQGDHKMNITISDVETVKRTGTN